MALSKEVKALVSAKKWQEAYDKASSKRDESNQDSFLIQITKNTTNEEGYVNGDYLNYSIVKDAEQASTFKQSDAKFNSKELRNTDNKNISTMLVKASDVLQQVGSQGTEKGEVIDLFLAENFTNKKKDIASIKNTLVKIIEELGFTYNTNPFLQFLDIFFKNHDTMKAGGLDIVNDLYANNEIETKDLQGKSVDADRHIIFNENLYNFSYDDAEFIVQAFKWLSNPYNIKTYMNNPKSLTKYGITDVKQIDYNKAKEVRDSVIFQNPKTYYKSPINTVEYIKSKTREFEVGGEPAQGSGDARKNLAINNRITDAEKWKKLATDNSLTAQQAQDLIAFLAKEYKLV